MSNAVHISKMTGKLVHMPAINTNTLTNEFCIRQHQTDTICFECYSFDKLQGHRKNCAPAFERNSVALSELIDYDDLPFLNYAYVRINGHGELINENHLDNIIAIAVKNPQCTFALWTNRVSLIRNRLDLIPDNRILVFSNPKVDRVIGVPRGFHKVFNNVSKGSTRPQNCSGRKCIECLACYRKDSGTDVIGEMVK